MSDESTGSEIREWRLTRGLSARYLAERLGVTEAELELIEQGRYPLSPAQVQALIDALGRPFDAAKADAAARAADAELYATSDLQEGLEQMRQGEGTVVRRRPREEWRHGAITKHPMDDRAGWMTCDRCGRGATRMIGPGGLNEMPCEPAEPERTDPR